MKNHPPRREIPEWSPRVEFEVTEVELKVELMEVLEEEGGGREYLREQENTRFLRFSKNILKNVVLWLFRVKEGFPKKVAVLLDFI